MKDNLNSSKYSKSCLLLTASLISLVAIPILLCTVVLPWATQGPSPQRLEREFQRDKDAFETVVEYLLSLDHEDVTIRRSNIEGRDFTTIEMFVGLGAGNVPIGDDDAREAVAHLFQGGYQIIGKDAYVITFLRWSALDAGRGIAFSIDGRTPGESAALQFLVEIEPLAENHWYFYYENFDLWRLERGSN